MRYRKRKKAAAQVMVMTVAVVAVLAALLVLACSQVFRVRGILIVGNRNLSKEDVIALSGVQEGDNLFSISDAELKKNMERNRYIEYLGHEFDYRGTLSLHQRADGHGRGQCVWPVLRGGRDGHGARVRGQRIPGHRGRAEDQ